MDRLDDIRPSVYRVSMKLLRLQKLWQSRQPISSSVSTSTQPSLVHLKAAFVQGGGANLRLDRQEVTEALDRMFHRVSQEVPGHLTAVEQMCNLVFQLFDRSGSGSVSAGSVQTLLLVLSAETLLVKYTALLDLSGTGSGSISRSGLRSLLERLNQVPAAVQEAGVFGGVDAALAACWDGVRSPSVANEDVLSWLQSEPPLLLWLPTLFRLFISQSVRHGVRCHTCKTTPITGLRFRCLRCVNVHVCQSCFLTDKHTRRHKAQHPLLEFCTQPTWREPLLWLVRRRRRAPSPPPGGTARDISHHASLSSNCQVQTVNSQHDQVMSLRSDVRKLQRDKWLLQQQLQDCRRAVQSQRSSQEDRSSGMRVTMETLRQQNKCLQDMLTQALDKMEAGQHSMSRRVTMETEEIIMPTCDAETCTDGEEDKRALRKKEEAQSEEELNRFPTLSNAAASANDVRCEDQVGATGGAAFCQQTGDSGDNGCWSAEDQEASCPERRLQQSVDRLRTLMETDGCRERRIAGDRWTELLLTAAQVEDSIHHLVDAVRTV